MQEKEGATNALHCQDAGDLTKKQRIGLQFFCVEAKKKPEVDSRWLRYTKIEVITVGLRYIVHQHCFYYEPTIIKKFG